MEIADFAEITQDVIDGTPFKDYVPTLCLPARNQIKALDWAVSSAESDEEFLLAFKDGSSHFRIILRIQGEMHEALFPTKNAYEALESTTTSITQRAVGATGL